MITFYIPGPLRSFTNGQVKVAIETRPATLREALQALWSSYPGLRDRLATEQGDLRPHISVFVGDQDIRYRGGLATPTPDGVEITIIPAISGG